jgi:hypothetical protein
MTEGRSAVRRLAHFRLDQADGPGWHAIKLAWPQYKIRDPMEMGQQTTTEWTTAETKTNNSLRALDIARNLFLCVSLFCSGA